MVKYDFEKCICKLTADGFDKLPEQVVDICEEAVLIYMGDNIFLIYDADEYYAVQENLYDIEDENATLLRLGFFTNSNAIEDVESLKDTITTFIERYQLEVDSYNEIYFEVSPQQSLFSPNQCIEMKIISMENGNL